MTEDEAYQKQCCGPEGAGHFNEDPHSTRWCVGSMCMAWRWVQAEKTEALSRAVQEHIARCGAFFNGREHEAVRIVIGNARLAREQGRSALDFSRVEGYCGLAGEPQ